MEIINSTKRQGFSLIELMVVIAIIGILAAVAIPSYNNYITRSRVMEMLTAVSGVQQSLVEYRSVKSSFVESNGDAISYDEIGSKDPSEDFNSIKEIKLFAPDKVKTVVVAVCGDADGLGLTGNTGDEAYLNIYFVGTWASSSLNWSCEYTGASQYVPTSCRKSYAGDKKCDD